MGGGGRVRWGEEAFIVNIFEDDDIPELPPL